MADSHQAGHDAPGSDDVVAVRTELSELGRRAVEASHVLAIAGTAQKDEALSHAADLLGARAGEILEANAADVARAETFHATATTVDRLRLTVARVAAMAQGLRTVAALADPIGEILEGHVRPNGLVVERVRVPLGVVGIIYENRPSVTSEAASLCLKSGNAALLRGSGSALRSNRLIATAIRDGAVKAGLPADAVVLVEDTRHETAEEFVQLRGVIDCLIPRGGAGLIAMILDKATVPYVLDGDGNCHVYVDAAADLDMAERIVVNAKTQRPSVCNAAESLVVHAAVAGEFLPRIARRLTAEGVELVGDERARALVPGIGPAAADDYGREYLDLKMSVAVVGGLDAAIAHIARYGSGHSEAIVTRDIAAARRFVREVDAAAVLVNASTRFVDGGELGLGAEVGISTQKLHARGPMGLRELTTVKYAIYGEGQVRT
ncbi:MAG: glutamate-5-semialdehyde dehydrogenase [Acidimicrobiales bacterium]|jgi:glutamate-5-semialdehyde dehydrogenase